MITGFRRSFRICIDSDHDFHLQNLSGSELQKCARLRLRCEMLLRCEGNLNWGVVVYDLMATPKSRNVNSTEMRESLLSLIPNLRGFAVSLCGDLEHADDLVQETLLKAWAHFEKFEPGTNLRAWLFTILRNHFFSECRARRHRSEDPDGHKLGALCVPASQDGYVDMQDFRKALNLLPLEQREALILVTAAGFSYEEAAKIGACAVGTIKSRVNRARAKLAQLLGVQAANEFGPDAATAAIIAQSSGRIGVHANGPWR